MDSQNSPATETAQTSPLAADYAAPALERLRAALRGNGVKAEDVQIASFKGGLTSFEASAVLTVRVRTMEKVIGGKKGGGEIVEGPQGAREAIEKGKLRIISSPEALGQIKNLVLERNDKGLGTRNEIIRLPFLTKEYVYHQPCRTCGAQGEIKCQRCAGKGFEVCPRCNGQSMEVCSQCRGAQLIFNGNNKVPCPHCSGQGRTPCSQCNQTRKITCFTCRAKGATACQTCNGQGWHSYITTAEIDVLCNFEFERGAVPDVLAPVVDARARELAALADIEILPSPPPENDDQIVIRYRLRLPYGEVEFALGRKNNIRAFLAGKNCGITEMPAFLEQALKPGINALREAAEGKGDVAAKIQRAGKYRTVRQAIIAAAKYPNKKAVALLLKNTPLGLGTNAAKMLVLDADEALKKITAKPRRNGVILGTALAALLYFIYMATPLRGLFSFAGEWAQVGIDGAVVTIGMALSIAVIQIAGGGAVKKALGKLLPPGQDTSFSGKAGHSGLWSAVLCVLFFLLACEMAIHAGQMPPGWYVVARGIVIKSPASQDEDRPVAVPQ